MKVYVVFNLFKGEIVKIFQNEDQAFDYAMKNYKWFVYKWEVE